jgi:polyhydroxyalkanoate synthase subunit PhaC
MATKPKKNAQPKSAKRPRGAKKAGNKPASLPKAAVAAEVVREAPQKAVRGKAKQSVQSPAKPKPLPVEAQPVEHRPAEPQKLKSAPVPLAADALQGSPQRPEEMAQNMMRLSELTSKAVQLFMQRAGTEPPKMPDASGAMEASRLAAEISRAWMSDPMKLVDSQGTLVKGYMDLWQSTLQRLSGQQAPAVAEADRGDNRFKHPDWTDNPYFDFWKQAYIMTSRWAETTLHQTPGLDQRTQAKAEFIQKQIISALAPSNFMQLNPEVIQATMKSNGRNLVEGMQNFVADLERSGTMLKISQTDTSAFEVGRNVATQPGKVVYQNELLQLIQYSPTTPDVHEIPFVLVPPWINKYYILDLTSDRSFIKFIVDQGFTVFVVSWVNPDERLKDKTFADYMFGGLLAATEAAKKECGTSKVNILGYCIGGTLLGTTLAWLARRGENPFNSATFLVAQVDFTKAGDLKLFIDEAQLQTIENMIDEKGYLEGSRMATVFNMLRPKDLIWPYVVNNYMMGKKPMAFDLLYWNQDSTRMPAANHKYYLREFYHNNKLAEGEMVIEGEKLDLGRVRVPIFHLATREDHISPPRSVYTGAKLFGGPVEFVLAGSGHIAGVVSPPGKTKYPYWTNKRPLSHPDCTTLDDWIAGADEVKDSWWPHWAKWLRQYSGGKVKPRKPGAKLGVIEDAPGSYVKVMS